MRVSVRPGEAGVNSCSPPSSSGARRELGNNPKTPPCPAKRQRGQALTATTASSNPTLVPDSNIVFGGDAMTITPAFNQAGTAVIIMTVSDGLV